MRLAAFGFLALYGVICGKLVYLGFKPDPQTLRRAASEAVSRPRPDIIDRNGVVLATDVKVMSVFAEPRRIVDKDEAVELLTAVLPDVNARELRERLSSRKGCATNAICAAMITTANRLPAVAMSCAAPSTQAHQPAWKTTKLTAARAAAGTEAVTTAPLSRAFMRDARTDNG